MSLDKAIKYRKEKRKPYYGSKAFDRSCRNHGSCPWCYQNRKHKFRDKRPMDKEDLDCIAFHRFYRRHSGKDGVLNETYNTYEETARLNR